MQDWAQSGLSAREYGALHACSAKSLYAWRAQCNRGADTSGGVSDTAPGRSPFVAVQLPASSGRSAPQPSITLRAQGVDLVLDGFEDARELVAWVKVLKREVFDV